MGRGGGSRAHPVLLPAVGASDDLRLAHAASTTLPGSRHLTILGVHDVVLAVLTPTVALSLGATGPGLLVDGLADLLEGFCDGAYSLSIRATSARLIARYATNAMIAIHKTRLMVPLPRFKPP